MSDSSNASENKPLRNEKGQLLPGQTANPHGRPKFSLITILKEELQKETDVEVNGDKQRMQIAKALILKIVHKAIKEEDVQLMKEILNRIEGMPKQRMSFGDDDDQPTSVKIEVTHGTPPPSQPDIPKDVGGA